MIKGNNMTHNEFLDYRLPLNWCAEESEDKLFLYNPDGNGAITISFFNVLSVEKSLEEQVCIIAKQFIDQNKIHTHSPLILQQKGKKAIVYGTGVTSDNWFIKVWVVSQFPKIVFCTYQSEQKSNEVEICDLIIDSFNFKMD